ncbi:MAG: sigma-54-dependent transcriptional regulator, partial [Bradyrhizobium canariense]
SPGSVLIVDDELKIRQLLAKALAEEGHDVVAIDSARAARQLLGTRIFDVLLVDNQMPEVTGLDLIRDITSTMPESERPQILMMTAHATVESALAAMKLGALDYLQKPFEIDELLVVVERAVEHQRLRGQHGYLLAERDEDYDHYGIVGRSKLMQDAVRTAGLVAQTKSTTLITGETGTGKELIARAIHEDSTRSDRPLIRVNCAAIPRELFESEFFGHVRGAFTGATRDRIGRFELADGGTLFLDEVGEIPLELQGKLLRVLQEGNFERVGQERTRAVDVRVIAATNRDLKQEVQRGRFREDLYFRLNVFPIETVPLRERREDIALLAQHFLTRESKALKSNLRLSEGDARRLTRYDWPGNVRELQNVIERAAILSQNGRLRIDLPDPSGTAVPAGAARQKADARPAVMTSSEMRDHERANILAALEGCAGKVFGPGGAAEMLDIKPTTLASRIKALGIAPRPRAVG